MYDMYDSLLQLTLYSVYFYVVGNIMTYNVTGLTTGTTYFFNVIAVNEVGEGPKSETATMKTGKNDAVFLNLSFCWCFDYCSEVTNKWETKRHLVLCSHKELRHTRVRTDFANLWKLRMPFSRTWRVLEESIFKKAMEQFWIFAWKNSKISWNGCS